MIGFLEGVQLRPAIGISIQQADVLVNVEQREVLALAVDIHQEGAQLAQQAQADSAAVNPPHAATLAAHLAPQGQQVWIIRQLFTLQDGLDLTATLSGDAEEALQHGPFSAGAHCRGIHLATHQRIQCIQDDGLACPGFAGEGRQPGRKVQLQVLDDGKVLNAQFG